MRHSRSTMLATMLLAVTGTAQPQSPGPAEPAASAARALVARAADPALRWAPCPPLFPTGCEIAVLHGDPAKPNADVFLRVPAGYAIPPHSHSSAERMVLVSGRLEVQYLGQPKRVLEVGDYAYGPPRLAHVARCVASTPCTLFIAFEQPVDALPYEGSIR